jgi:hypothetical protein
MSDFYFMVPSDSEWRVRVKAPSYDEAEKILREGRWDSEEELHVQFKPKEAEFLFEEPEEEIEY